MSFEIVMCPLCNKELVLQQSCNLKTYTCPTVIPIIVNGNSLAQINSHYAVDYSPAWKMQRIIILPWSLDNFVDKTRIYKYSEIDHQLKWRFIKELPLIKADTQDNMLTRLNKLMMFL